MFSPFEFHHLTESKFIPPLFTSQYKQHRHPAWLSSMLQPHLSQRLGKRHHTTYGVRELFRQHLRHPDVSLTWARSLLLSQRRNKEHGKECFLGSLRISKWFLLTGKRGCCCFLFFLFFVFPKAWISTHLLPGKSMDHLSTRVGTVFIFRGKSTPFQAVTPSSVLCCPPHPKLPNSCSLPAPPKITVGEVETTKLVNTATGFQILKIFVFQEKWVYLRTRILLAYPVCS